MNEPIGRRERKKAQTRQSLADAALRLFLDRGYDQVGVKDVADAADVSVTTLFKHFPCKEALVFDRDDDFREALVGAVRDRVPGRSIPQALCEYVRTTPGPYSVTAKTADEAQLATFLRLVEETPALTEYAHHLWTRHETDLARAIAQEVGAPEDDVACTALARFALEVPSLAWRHADPQRAAEEAFALLERGWAQLPVGNR
ncbi:TetR/AcrR family transcriptional regulator [Streptomyces sp. CA-132043]|uniref:TetR/AcrR family transcriptional regulator n=1 Tax=Streptomyces sp. CA-132043 TaxID=3240048 RepID=UPI003D8B37B0